MSAAPDQLPGKTTTMTALKPVPPPEQHQVIAVGFESLQAFEALQRIAKMFASSTVVPDTFRGNLGNCAIATEMAMRMRASPLMVMQNLDVIYGRPSWRAKFLIACFNQCGRFEAVSYEWSGTEGKDDWACRALSKELATNKLIRGPKISIALAKEEGWYDKKGSKWKTIPELMLMYRASAWMINTTAPEISMGLPTGEEVHDTYDAQRDGQGKWAVDLESLRQQTQPDPKKLPQIPADPKAWAEKLNACKTTQELSTTWQECVEAFGNDGAPNDCDSAYQNRREWLGENEGKQLEL